jgi:tRNA(Phe) wybutosine-synthesizing methylase Tyw3
LLLLPSIEPYRIDAEGEVAWADAKGRIGINLSHMPVKARRKYAEWLDVLHSQLEFRTLSEEASQMQTMTVLIAVSLRRSVDG